MVRRGLGIKNTQVMKLPKRPIPKDELTPEIGYICYSSQKRGYFSGFFLGLPTFSSKSRAKIYEKRDFANRVARKFDLEVQQVIEL